MFRAHAVLAILWVCPPGKGLCAQVVIKVDFGRDVLPIFRQNCVG